ncbi:MAG TPA: hypothetical protein GXZ47_05845 [Treponema sp.]|nr:hypothetical protein [Treponema sp.]
MAEDLATFERLVKTLESSERQNLLLKLASTTELSTEDSQQRARHNILSGDGAIIPEEQFIQLHFLWRLWFGVCSLFSSASPVQIYTRSMVQGLGKKLARSSSVYIDSRLRLYSSAMYEELKRLKKIQSFFGKLLSSYEENKGGFFIILSSLMIKKTAESIASAADPFAFPAGTVDQKDVRLSCIRAMDSVLTNIPAEERARMYQSAQAIEWMRRFCSVPLDRILLRFDIMSGVTQGCPVDSVTEEMKSLVNVLLSAHTIPVLMLEAMFLFSEQEKIRESGYDLEKECSIFLTSASAHLLTIAEFKATIPLADFVRFSIHDVSWQPLITESGEDWFMLFRNAWKKRFEQRWTTWNREHRRETLKTRMVNYLEVDDLPVLAYRPWEGMWLPLSMRRDLSLVFLKGFFSSVYPSVVMKPLKVVLIEGDFYKRENLMEYTDAFSNLEHGQGLIEGFEQRLSPKGDIGEGFDLVQREKMATVKGKARLDNMMLTTDSEVEMLISQAVTAFNSMDLILGGIIEVVRGGPYETLVNMASIQGKQNEKFRKELTHVRQLIREASLIIIETEKLEKETM